MYLVYILIIVLNINIIFIKFSHVRALGFLYLRYVCKPENLWSWFEEFLDDEEEVQVEGGVYPRKM